MTNTGLHIVVFFLHFMVFYTSIFSVRYQCTARRHQHKRILGVVARFINLAYKSICASGVYVMGLAALQITVLAILMLGRKAMENLSLDTTLHY